MEDGTRDNFAFMIHPLHLEDVTKSYPWLRVMPSGILKGLLRFLPPVVASEIEGVKSRFNEVEGWFVGCFLTSAQMVELPTEMVLDKIIAAGRLAEDLGAKILGLGAYTSIVGDAGRTVADNLHIPVTTGNSYTVATALQGAREAAGFMGVDMKKARTAVVGATGSIGKVCAEVLAREVSEVVLISRTESKLRSLASELRQLGEAEIEISTRIEKSLPTADVVLTVSSAVDSIIAPEVLKSGAVVCDVARPRDVSRQVRKARNDVLVIEGGVVEVPGDDVRFNLDFGFPPGTAMACMAETMMLALEKRYESFTLGRDITVEQVDEISRLAEKHDFKLAGFRSFDRSLPEEEMKRIRSEAERRQKEGK